VAAPLRKPPDRRRQRRRACDLISKIEKERKAIFERLNNKGRRLEKKSPIEAAELNDRLRKVVEWLSLRLRR
jgi:hypothetical protein